MACFAAIFCFASLPIFADASAFRGSTPIAAMGRMSVEELRATMLEELMAAFGSGNRVNERLSSIEDALRPTFLSMPKNSYGNLEHSSVRYVLHRLFVQRHGMYVKGLHANVEVSNGSSPTDLLDDKVPAYMQALFEERLNGQGLGMHELAILAATLEHLIHNEAVRRLEISYQAHDFDGDSLLKNNDVEDVVDTYMTIFILGKNVSELSSDMVMSDRANIQAIYPTWPDTQKFTRSVKDDVMKSNSGSSDLVSDAFTFKGTSQVVEEVGERYGRWQDSECQDLKKALLKLEAPGSGRVLLKDFYGNALGGAWQFTESVEYLRELGALDETYPKGKSVIISNYINSPTNCLASSGLYSVCCLNECEPLLGHIEKSVGEPEADPQTLMRLVSELPSSTVSAPRQLSSTLKDLLSEVSSHHDGRVPIHGRLFSQWMHHAFPRECPYPHKAGTTTPLTADQWMMEKGGMAVAEIEEMEKHAKEFEAHARESQAQTDSPTLMWSAEEELVVTTRSKSTGAFRPLKTLVMLVAIGSFGWSMRQSLGFTKADKATLPFAGKQHFC